MKLDLILFTHQLPNKKLIPKPSIDLGIFPTFTFQSNNSCIETTSSLIISKCSPALIEQYHLRIRLLYMFFSPIGVTNADNHLK